MYVHAYACLSVFVSTWNQQSMQGAVQQPLFRVPWHVRLYKKQLLRCVTRCCISVFHIHCMAVTPEGSRVYVVLRIIVCEVA